MRNMFTKVQKAHHKLRRKRAEIQTVRCEIRRLRFLIDEPRDPTLLDGLTLPTTYVRSFRNLPARTQREIVAMLKASPPQLRRAGMQALHLTRSQLTADTSYGLLMQMRRLTRNSEEHIWEKLKPYMKEY